MDINWWTNLLFYYGFVPGGIMTFVVLLIRKALDVHWGDANVSQINARNKICVITGASSGVGFATAVELANRGATVIVTGRTKKAARKVFVAIRNQTFLGTIVPLPLELASLESVRNFCREIQNRYNRLDILINNAGVLLPPLKRSESEDGFEMHFAVNHLSHFLITSLLFPLIKNAQGRVVIVSSLAHRGFVIDANDFQMERDLVNEPSMSKNPLYQNSKFSNLLFARELRKRAKVMDLNIRVYACCPGLVKSNISRNLELPWYYEVLMPVVQILFKTPEQGARTVVKCALTENLADDDGILYRHCAPWNPNDRTYPDDWFESTAKANYSEEDARKLWRESERLCDVQFNVE